MPALSKKNLAARAFFETEFAPRFPKSYRALTKVVMSAARVARDTGKRSWLGRDKGKAAWDSFINDTTLLTACLFDENYYRQAAGDNLSDIDKAFRLVRFFFTAHPNWPDAEAVWGDFEKWLKED